MEWLESAEDTLAREKSNVAVKKLLSKISFAKKAFTERKSTWKRDVELGKTAFMKSSQHHGI